jgi:hypothetical protein
MESPSKQVIRMGPQKIIRKIQTIRRSAKSLAAIRIDFNVEGKGLLHLDFPA